MKETKRAVRLVEHRGFSAKEAISSVIEAGSEDRLAAKKWWDSLSSKERTKLAQGADSPASRQFGDYSDAPVDPTLLKNFDMLSSSDKSDVVRLYKSRK